MARTYKPYGPVLSDAINDQLRTVLGPSGKRPAYIAERVKKTWELGDGWAKHVTVEVALGTREGTSVRGRRTWAACTRVPWPMRPPSTRSSTPRWRAVAARAGVGVSLPSAGGGARRTVDAAALGEFADQITGRDGVLASAARLVLGQLGLDNPVTAPERPPTPSSSTWSPPNSVRTGHVWWRRSSTPRRPSCSTTAGPAPARTCVKLWLTDEGEIDADWPRLSERFEGAGHVVATQASWWQGKALAAGRTIHASLYGRAAAGAENPGPGRYSDEVAVVTGASKGSIAASVVAQLLDGGATVIATTSKLDDDRLAFYRTLVSRSRPVRRHAVGGAGQHGVLLRHRRAGLLDRQRADRKPWAAVDSPQGRADPDAAVPVRGAARRRRSVRGRLRAPRWR